MRDDCWRAYAFILALTHVGASRNSDYVHLPGSADLTSWGGNRDNPPYLPSNDSIKSMHIPGARPSVDLMLQIADINQASYAYQFWTSATGYATSTSVAWFQLSSNVSYLHTKRCNKTLSATYVTSSTGRLYKHCGQGPTDQQTVLVSYPSLSKDLCEEACDENSECTGFVLDVTAQMCHLVHPIGQIDPSISDYTYETWFWLPYSSD